MEYQLVNVKSQTFLECLPCVDQLATEADALDLVAACGEVGTNRLMLHAENLPAAFYDLRSGFAGNVLLKFSNYRLRVAAVLTPELVNQGRFREMALETNRGNQFRIFYDRQSAQDWLVSE